MSNGNPLCCDRTLQFLLYEVLHVETLCELPAFTDHSPETFDALIETVRKYARRVLLPSYQEIDQNPPTLQDGRVTVPPKLHELLNGIVDLGLVSASRPEWVGGTDLPISVYTAASCYLMAGNLSAFAYVGLTLGAAHLIEAFGDEALQSRYMQPMYKGLFTGTMALTEPAAGSSLADITTVARPQPEGHYKIAGSKMFISGGDHDMRENIVHMVLARIQDAPTGAKGISLFLVPKLRFTNRQWQNNDVTVAGLIHKIGWKGIPSLAMNYGDNDDCHGYLIGEPNRGLAYMFQMMNEARIMVAANGISTASVAYQESLLYAKERQQGRRLGHREGPQIPIIEHADVKRMLLRQKAIVEGGLALLLSCAKYVDLAKHGQTPAIREGATLLQELLTPVAKSFAADKGYEANVLALQIHGGYGYSSEYFPESWLRDQKLNSIHEGTTGIQGLDLLGRKVIANSGKALGEFTRCLQQTCERGQRVGLSDWSTQLSQGCDQVVVATEAILSFSDTRAMLRHSNDYLDMFSALVIGWLWLEMACVAQEHSIADGAESDFYRGKYFAAQYWFATEVPRIASLAQLCSSNDSSYADMPVDGF